MASTGRRRCGRWWPTASSSCCSASSTSASAASRCVPRLGAVPRVTAGECCAGHNKNAAIPQRLESRCCWRRALHRARGWEWRGVAIHGRRRRFGLNVHHTPPGGSRHSVPTLGEVGLGLGLCGASVVTLSACCVAACCAGAVVQRARLCQPAGCPYGPARHVDHAPRPCRSHERRQVCRPPARTPTPTPRLTECLSACTPGAAECVYGVHVCVCVCADGGRGSAER